MSAAPARGRVTVLLSAIEANYRRFARISGAGGCAAVVKANAYGLGAGPIARRLARAGCQAFFVASVDEGIALRRELADPEIFLFDGFPDGAAGELVDHRLTPVLNTPDQHRDWRASGACEAGLRTVWLVDSGMSRLGMDIDECLALVRSVRRPPDLLMTHLACAETPDHPLNDQQLARFAAIQAALPDTPISLSNTAACQMGRSLPDNLSRIGIGLLGSNPTAAPTLRLDEAVQVHGSVLQKRRVPAGTPAGYDATWRSQQETTLLTVGVGYADGYLRSLGDNGWAALAGERLPLAGRVSMDYLVVDAAAVDKRALAACREVALIGDGVDIDALAAAGGTISYELLTRLGPRLPVRYLD